MPQKPAKLRRNHPPVYPYPKNSFFPTDMSDIVTRPLEQTPLETRNRYQVLTDISEHSDVSTITVQPQSLPPRSLPSSSSSSRTTTPPQTPTTNRTTQPHDHSYCRPPPPSTQLPSNTLVSNWVNESSSSSSSSPNSYVSNSVASSNAPEPQAALASAPNISPAATQTQEPAHTTHATAHPSPPTSHTHTPASAHATHATAHSSPSSSQTQTPRTPTCKRQTIIIDNITTKHTRVEIETQLRSQFPGASYDIAYLKRGPIAGKPH